MKSRAERRDRDMKVRFNTNEHLALLRVAQGRGISVAACAHELLVAAMNAQVKGIAK